MVCSEFVTVPGVGLFEQCQICGDIGGMLELIGADGCQYPDDSCLFGILDLFLGGTPERPSALVESDNHCSHSADGCALQQTCQRFSSED